MDVLAPFFFCLDHLNNFFISDYWSYSIRVFSPEGNLLLTIGKEGHQPGMLFYPDGAAVTPNRRRKGLTRPFLLRGVAIHEETGDIRCKQFVSPSRVNGPNTGSYQESVRRDGCVTL